MTLQKVLKTFILGEKFESRFLLVLKKTYCGCRATETEPIYVVDNDVTSSDVIKHIVKSGQEEAFMVLDIDDIIHKHRQWATMVDPVKPYYAVKANDNSVVLKVLAALGTGFDCASKAELRTLVRIKRDLKNVPSDVESIIFANPTKIIQHLQYARSIHVGFTTFDCEEELHKIKKFHPTAKLLIRIRSDAKRARFSLGRKFGCDPVNEAPFLLRLAKTLELNVIGVAFHVGSGCEEPESFDRGISAARSVFDHANNVYNFNFNILDIGGGYPGKKRYSFKEYADVIKKALCGYFSDVKLRVISEPGCYFVASAFTLAVHVHSRKVICNEDSISNVMYFVDDGIFGTLSAGTYGEPQEIPVPVNKPSGESFPSTVWGPTCDSLDCIIKDIPLPLLQIGDWLKFDDMGAYTTVLSTNFNGIPAPNIFPFVTEENWHMLRDSELFKEEAFVFKEICRSPKCS